MNYYRCENPDCGFLAEEEPDVCPQCGGTFFLSVDEEELTGPDWVQLGNRAVDEERPTDALACYQQAAALDDMLGVTNLGWCLEAGIGVPADPRQAVVLYAQAAARDYMPALTNLGYCYAHGIGVARDDSKAVECFRKGAENGFSQGPVPAGGGIFPRPGSGAERRGGRPLVSVRRVAGLSRGADRTGALPGVRHRPAPEYRAGGEMVPRCGGERQRAGPMLPGVLV